MDVGEGVLERAALAFVDLVHQHMADGAGTQLVEPVLMLLVAAVVHDDDVTESRLDQSVRYSLESVVGIEGGQHDRNGSEAGCFFFHVSLLK